MKLLYELGYRSLGVRLDMGPAEELIKLLGSGRISPCRAIDLGCGTGRNALFLAQNGFEALPSFSDIALSPSMDRSHFFRFFFSLFSSSLH